MKQQIEQLIQAALTQLKTSGELLVSSEQIQIEATKDPKHGDYASNIALLLAKPNSKNPRELAHLIVKQLPSSTFIREVQIAGPGFINFYLAAGARFEVLRDILTKKEHYGRASIGQGKKALVEFLSANPNGPIHVGHGRSGVYGSVVADLLAAIGYDVSREYYVNDAGRQMDILAASVWVRYLTLTGETIQLPANAYRGDYVIQIAEAFFTEKNNDFVLPVEKILTDLPPDEPDGGDKEIFIDAFIVKMKTLLGAARYEALFQFALDRILTDIREDLAATRVTYQNWFSERDFVKTNRVNEVIELLRFRNLTYEQEGALWFRATDFGDEKDRVLCRSNGVRTYFANDLGYHFDKFARGFDLAIDIFGSDHHGYVPRMRAGLVATGILAEKIHFLLVQFVTLYREGKQIQMSTRSGSFITLRELREEVGVDATRYFYLMRKCNQHVDFDLDLAKSQSNENPVYYIQYAHARICSVFRQLKEKNLTRSTEKYFSYLHHLTDAHEHQLLGELQRYPEVIMNAATQFEPQILTNYLYGLAQHFHSYYNTCVFLDENNELREARLTLISAVQQVLINGLSILNISAPEAM